jgi:hypothetical protein
MIAPVFTQSLTKDPEQRGTSPRSAGMAQGDYPTPPAPACRPASSTSSVTPLVRALTAHQEIPDRRGGHQPAAREQETGPWARQPMPRTRARARASSFTAQRRERRSGTAASPIKWSQRVTHQTESDKIGIPVGEDFLHMAQGRGSAAAAWDPAVGPRAAGGAGAPSSRTPPHPTPTSKRAAPRTSSRTPLSTRAVSTVYCADDGRGRRVPGCRKPQPSPCRPIPSSNPCSSPPYRHRSR